jgi:Aspartyl/Asparaginyl beta-hydroxylase
VSSILAGRGVGSTDGASLPNKHIPPHRGPSKGVLRYHLALRTPTDETAARIRVGSRTEHWRDGRSLIFDDTFEHEAWNDSDDIRVVLFVDVIRKLPWYLAAPDHAFIGVIRKSPFVQRALANNEAWQETLVPQRATGSAAAIVTAVVCALPATVPRQVLVALAAALKPARRALPTRAELGY